MNKKIIVIGFILILVCVSLSGCNQQDIGELELGESATYDGLIVQVKEASRKDSYLKIEGDVSDWIDVEAPEG